MLEEILKPLEERKNRRKLLKYLPNWVMQSVCRWFVNNVVSMTYLSKINQIIEQHTDEDGVTEIGIKGVKSFRDMNGGSVTQAIRFADWDDAFAAALLRLWQLIDRPADKAILAEAGLREVYYAVLRGEVSGFARQAFGVENSDVLMINHHDTRAIHIKNRRANERAASQVAVGLQGRAGHWKA